MKSAYAIIITASKHYVRAPPLYYSLLSVFTRICQLKPVNGIAIHGSLITVFGLIKMSIPFENDNTQGTVMWSFLLCILCWCIIVLCLFSYKVEMFKFPYFNQSKSNNKKKKKTVWHERFFYCVAKLIKIEFCCLIEYFSAL